MDPRVKSEFPQHLSPRSPVLPILATSLPHPPSAPSVIDLTDDDDDDDHHHHHHHDDRDRDSKHFAAATTSSSSSSDSASDHDHRGAPSFKRRKLAVLVPHGFLAPLPLSTADSHPPSSPSPSPSPEPVLLHRPPSTRDNALAQQHPSKQFWKAGDYDGGVSADWALNSGGIDHVRVHPKFLHSNATSHKWALGAFAELLDNSLDEVCNGATYVNADMLNNKKDGSRMLLIEDNGGGMDPDKMRQCISLGYSAKSKMANTIGQYGNGFKTSTMRLGADVIVFSRCQGEGGKSPTQSIGMLSYTFLRSTGMEDIVVPMLDYEKRRGGWDPLKRSTSADWNKNVETIIQWSPFASEADLLRQFTMMEDHGTRIIIYNLWEDDQGLLELDFDADPHDIQLRGVNRDEKNIQMAKRFPNSRHFLTYKHSLRSYASILYLRLPPSFRMIIRGKDVEHHNIVNDMMLSQEVTYRPQPGADGVPKDNMAAIVTIGFVKDAMHHIDVQGFNVYHKNRLIKPFWRLWNPAASHGRGVIGVLEANFVEPAHDKQGFERTTVLARLEGRLIQMQKNYWHTNCQRIGYSSVNNKKSTKNPASTDHAASSGRAPFGGSDKFPARSQQQFSPSVEHLPEDDVQILQSLGNMNGSIDKTFSRQSSYGKDGAGVPALRSNLSRDCIQQDYAPPSETNGYTPGSQSKGDGIALLKQENRELRERLEKIEVGRLCELQHDLESEKERSRALEIQLKEAQEKIEELTREQDSQIEIFSEERERREAEEQNLRKKLKDASSTIQDLLDKVRVLENMKCRPNRKSEG